MLKAINKFGSSSNGKRSGQSTPIRAGSHGPLDTMQSGSIQDASVHGACECPFELDTLEKKINHWITGGYWISIKLKEGRNLGVYDYDTQSSDPFAKLRLTLPGDKAPVITEYRTRTVHRNLSPMFEESLLCPLSGLSPECVFYLLLYDEDWLRAEFMGQIKSTLGHLLETVERPGKPSSAKWYALVGKASKAKNSYEGELLLEVDLLTYTQAEEQRRTQEKFRRPEFLEARFNDCQLELLAKSMRFSHKVRDVNAINDLLNRATLEVRVGQSMIRQQIKPKVKEGLKSDQALELELDDKIVIPLQAAFRVGSLMWDRKSNSEIADVKVYFCLGAEQIFKTQVPLWAVPTHDEEDDESCVDGDEVSASPTHSSRADTARSSRVETAPSSKMDNAPNSRSEPLSVSEARARSTKAAQTPAGSGVLQPDVSVPNSDFFRNMEQYSNRYSLNSCLLGFSLDIVPRQVAGTGPTETEGACECTVLDVCEDQEDERDAPPLKVVPPPLETMVMEGSYSCGPCKLYQLLFKAGSELANQIAQREGLTKMDVGPWGLASCVDGKQARQRTIKYTKPLTIPIPFAPKAADVTEVHTLHIKEVSGWMLEIVITTDAPKGDTFRVVNQVLCMRKSSAESCSIRVSMVVDFLKNVGFLKGAIQGGALKDTCKHWQEEVHAALNAHLEGAGADAPGNKQTAAPQLASLPPPPPKGICLMQCLPVAMVVVGVLFVGVVLALAYQGWRASLEVSQKLVEAVGLLVAAQEQLVALHTQASERGSPV